MRVGVAVVGGRAGRVGVGAGAGDPGVAARAGAGARPATVNVALFVTVRSPKVIV